MIAVGGWSWSSRFSDAALTDAARTVFADSCVDFIVKYGLDGVDIDWEYPVVGGLSTNIRRPEDKYNFTLLMQKLREKLDLRGATDGKDYILSFAGAAGSWYLNNIELSKLSQYVDYANVMTYDLHGSWDSYTDFNAPLYDNSDVSPQYKGSVDQSVNSWLQTGFPAEKLIMGVPFYGYLYKAVGNSNNGLYQTYSGAASISYANIAANYLNAPGYVRFFHNVSKIPWLFNGTNFISYEDAESMGLKASYIKSKDLGGAMIWELSQDPNEVLLSALYQGLK
ncbi:MAG: glycoside hydrolase family 18 [Herbinix sp.]|nr:glycoside hydrolase family 18 [Herbinix sp.]